MLAGDGETSTRFEKFHKASDGFDIAGTAGLISASVDTGEMLRKARQPASRKLQRVFDIERTECYCSLFFEKKGLLSLQRTLRTNNMTSRMSEVGYF